MQAQDNKNLWLYFYSTLVWFGLLLFTLAIIYRVEVLSVVERSEAVVLSFIVIGLISISGIAIEVRRRPYSMNIVHWLFFFMFFFLAPLCQYLTNRFGAFPYYFSRAANTSDILFVNFLLIMWALFYGIAYHLFSVLKHRKKVRGAINGSMSGTNLYVTPSGIRLALLLSLVALFLFLNIFGLSNLTTRALYIQALYKSIESSPFRLIISNLIRAIPILTLAALLVTKSFWKRRTQWWIFIFMVSVITLIVNNPLGAARYWSGSLLSGFAVLLFFRKCRSGVWFVLVLMIGLLIIAPIINVTRILTVQKLSPQAFSMANLIHVLTSGDLDAYVMMLYTVKYVCEMKAPTWGYQLIGSMLFWIPRSFWPNKPLGSGAIVASEFGFPNVNVSCPLPAEGYINFGIFGLIIFAIGLGWLLATLDYAYWKRRMAFGKRKVIVTSFLSIVYPFLLGYLIFIMRGDMMSSVSSTIMFVMGGIPLLIRCPLRAQ